jgi:signal recognition particle receptor subunit beta
MAKIVVGGGPGVGTTTFVRSASEIPPLEGDLGGGRPGTRGSPGPTRAGGTTVGFDFGRVTLPPGLSLQLFGLPSRPRSRLLADVVTAGCCGVVVVVDERRPASSAAVLDRARRLGVPSVVAVNRIGDRATIGEASSPLSPPLETPSPRDVGGWLAARPPMPVVSCDARSRESVRACLGVLAGVLRTRLEAAARAGRRDQAPAEGRGTG